MTRRRIAIFGGITATLVSVASILTFLPWSSSTPSNLPTSPSPSVRDNRASETDAGRGVYPFGRVVVVAIGINKYPQLKGTPNLAFAEADAVDLAAMLHDKFGYETVTLLGAAATKSRIEETLDRYGSELGKDDALIVFFAGHGQVLERPGQGESGYLVPADARLDLNDRKAIEPWDVQAIDMQRLTTRVDAMKARHVLVIADACASGFMTKRGSLERWDLKTFLFERSRTVLAAATRNQSAREDPKRGHGHFTAALLTELSKGDAASTLDVFMPVLKSVAESTNGGMTPQLASVGEGDGMFVFIPQSLSKEEIDSDLGDTKPLQSGKERGLQGVAARARALAAQATSFQDVLLSLDAFDPSFAVEAETKRREWEERFGRFKRNALSGDVWAMAALHFCYEKGLGTERDAKQAYEWAREADRAVNPPGLGRFLLGRCYEFGLGVPVSGAAGREQAIRYYTQSIEQGSPLGCYGLGLLLTSSKEKSEVVRGKELLQRAISGGVLPAEVNLATELLEHPVGEGDKAKAVAMLERAAKRGDPHADVQLYFAYADGSPNKRIEDAKSHLEHAASLGLVPAMSLLGLEYQRLLGSRLGLTEDLERSYALLDRSARAGEPRALRFTAIMLAAGRGVPRDYALARERLDAAVRGGGVQASYLQGLWYLDGLAYPQDDAKALSSFKRAADLGDAGACYMTASLYAEGRGVTVKPRWRQELGFHSHWHVALHYWSRARELGVEGDPVQERIALQIRAFRDALQANERSYVAPPEARRIPFLASALIAKQIAAEWKAAYPDSYAYFCRETKIDPDSHEDLKPEIK